MKFFLLEISEGDVKIAGKSVYEYSTLNEAVASFHFRIGSAMKSELFTSELVMIINSDGGIHKSEKWVLPIAPESKVITDAFD